MTTGAKILTLLLLCGNIGLVAQSYKPGPTEKTWALWHPFAALKIKRIGKLCEPVYKQTLTRFKLPDFTNGGGPDAFRHTFYMAAFAQKVSRKKLRKLGRAHEKRNYRDFKKARKEEGELPDSMACVMDLNNNELGFKLGAANKKLSLDELKELVLNEINSGNALIIKRTKNGTYLDCKNKVIDLKSYSGHWYIPKCLVPSNTPYSD